MNIVLIGFMASGKTTIGKALAQALGLEFVDTDDLIEAVAGKKISRIFADDGEEAFRKLETEQLKQLQKTQNKLISCGGGIVIKPENRTLLKKIGKVIFLKVKPLEVLKRVPDYTTRPLINYPDPAKRLEIIEDLLKKRDNWYNECAVLTVETTTGDIAKDKQQILKYLQRKKQ